MQRFLKLERAREVVRISPFVVLALGCLLVGFELGAISKALERSPKTVEVSVKSQGGFAREACAGRPIPRVDGGWAVVYGDEEC